MQTLVIDTNSIVKKLDTTSLVTKFDLEKALHWQTWGLVGIIFAQGALVVALIQYFK